MFLIPIPYEKVAKRLLKETTRERRRDSWRGGEVIAAEASAAVGQKARTRSCRKNWPNGNARVAQLAIHLQYAGQPKKQVGICNVKRHPTAHTVLLADEFEKYEAQLAFQHVKKKNNVLAFFLNMSKFDYIFRGGRIANVGRVCGRSEMNDR